MNSDPAPELGPAEIEVRLAQLEAQVLAHAERIAEWDAAHRARQRRALWIRLVVLALALVAFFALRAWGPGRAP